jgi:parallel beta-helix repeat protein
VQSCFTEKRKPNFQSQILTKKINEKRNTGNFVFSRSITLNNKKRNHQDYIMTRLKNTLKKTSALVGMCLLLSVISSQAANLTVSNTADAGNGSLRQAIIDATVNAEANIVTFNILTTDPGYNAAQNRFTINLLNPLPDIPLAAMTINNNQPQGVTVNGNNSFRILTLVDSAVVIINNLTISNGFSNGEVGGGIYMGNSSTLTLNGSTVSDNTASGNGGGVYMSNSATLFLANTTITRNVGSNGGGIYIHNSGTLNINTSTVNANSTAAGGNGGGIFNGTSGTINATSSTIDSNTAEGGNGGGIYNTATITFTNNTITDNNADSGGGIYNNFTATLENNLVALNTASDGTDLLGRGSRGNAFVGTYNLVGNADGSEGLAPETNQLGTTDNPIDPLIGSLSNNGGLTLTRTLLNNSPAIDKGNSASIITDQRGQTRPIDLVNYPNAVGGNGTDIGAFEVQFAPTAANVTVGGRSVDGIRTRYS